MAFSSHPSVFLPSWPLCGTKPWRLLVSGQGVDSVAFHHFRPSLSSILAIVWHETLETAWYPGKVLIQWLQQVASCLPPLCGISEVMAALTAEALRSLDFAASATKAAWDVASTAASTAASTGAAATELTVSAVTTANYVKQGGAALIAAEVQAVKSVGQAGGAMAGAVLKVAGGIVSAAVGIWDITAGIWGLVQGHGHQAMMEKINKACDAVLHQCHYVVVNDPRAVQVQQDVESLRTWIREFDWHCGVHNGWQNGTKVFSGVAGVASGVLLLLAPFTFGATLIPSAIVGGVAFTTSITNVIASGFVNADHARQLQEKLDALNRSMDGCMHTWKRLDAGSKSLAPESQQKCWNFTRRTSLTSPKVFWRQRLGARRMPGNAARWPILEPTG